MRAKLTGTDAYLEQWRRGDPEPIEGDLETAADAATETLERYFTAEVLRQYVANDGFAPSS